MFKREPAKHRRSPLRLPASRFQYLLLDIPRGSGSKPVGTGRLPSRDQLEHSKLMGRQIDVAMRLDDAGGVEAAGGAHFNSPFNRIVIARDNVDN